MNKTTTHLCPPDAAGIAEAAEALRAGKLVSFPTETVYGLGADATNGTAVANIFAAKGRPRFNPLIVHVTGAEQARRHVVFSAVADRLAETFWPGPLTLVLPRRADSPLSLLVSAGLPTVAIRAPSHPLAHRVIAAAGRPIAAPSANRSGKVSATTAQHVRDGLDGRVDVILDGGQTPIGVESTVLGFAGDRAVLLRPGGTPREDIEKITGPLLMPQKGVITSPGQMSSHYAPKAQVRLNAESLEPGETLLAFGPVPPEFGQTAYNLSPAGDLAEAAANLFAMLLALDTTGARRIAVMPIPKTGLGEAINDRLVRAAAPRPPETT